MSDTDLARSHVERCLQDIWGTHDICPDQDGDYPYSSGSVSCWIGIDPGDPPLVKATACAAVEVKRSGRLLTELNELNARCRTARVYWCGGSVMVEQSMLAHTVDRRSLAQAGQSVAAVANDIGPMIATVFGGHTPLEALDQVAE